MDKKKDKDISDRCIWHRHAAIPRHNPTYESCRTSCDGYNSKCIIYTPRQKYFKDLLYHKEFLKDLKELEEKNQLKKY